jgi:hypothetical protein
MACLLEFLDVFSIGDAFAMFRQTGPEDIRNKNNVGLFANGTCGLRWFSQMFCSANEFWVRIADRLTTDAATLHLINEGATRQLMVDNSDVTSQHVNGETHEPSR